MKKKINLDTSTAINAIALTTGSNFRYSKEDIQLLKLLKTQQMVMCETALGEFRNILQRNGGKKEKERGIQLEKRMIIVPDDPSDRALNLRETRQLGKNNIIIFGTGDKLGIITMTADQKAIRAASGQGVNFEVDTHPPCRLQGI